MGEGFFPLIYVFFVSVSSSVYFRLKSCKTFYSFFNRDTPSRHPPCPCPYPYP